MPSPKRIAVLASGSGTNAQNIFETFRDDESVEIVVLMSNKKDAYALTRAENFEIPTYIFDREAFTSGIVLEELQKLDIDLIVLAGFLWKIPDHIVKAFDMRIINIHPSLLPNYGGKGMYGMNVHNAVIANKDEKSGITIHYVNEYYDEGKVIFQTTCEISEEDNPETLAGKIHDLEYANFPGVIKQVADQLD